MIKQPQVVLAILFALALAGNAYYFQTHVTGVESDFASSSLVLANRVQVLEEEFAVAKTLNTDLSKALAEAEKRREDVEEQIDDIADTVDTLEKLSKTDQELLQKYSKVYFLNEHYVPSRLAEIATKYLSDALRPLQIHSSVKSRLEKMLAAAGADDIVISVVSAYRSFGTQATLKAGYRFTYGAGTANQFSAEQGFSEHQLGTTVDLTTPAIGGSLAGFEKTPAYAWLTANAYRYGFTLSYPPGNTYYQFEPWHWRFVGTDLARRLHNESIYFYDLDQREIDRYLAEIFD